MVAGRQKHKEGGQGLTASLEIQADWLRKVLFEQGYLARMKGEAIKVYLVVVEEAGGQPDRSVSLSLRELMERTELSCPTVIDCLARLERLGLVVATTRERGKVKTYYIANPTVSPPLGAPTEP